MNPRLPALGSKEMISIFFKLVVTLVLLVTIWIAILFLWGTTHNSRSGISLSVLVLSTIVGLSCLWGLLRIWRETKQGDKSSVSVDQQNYDQGPEVVADEERRFNEWVGANIVGAGDLPPKTIKKLRKKFKDEQKTKMSKR